MSEALTLERGFMRSSVRAARSAALGLVGAAALWTGGCGLILGLDEYSPAADAHCANGVKDADEPAVDCGGTACAQCVDGERCVSSADCVSQVCGGGTCKAPACGDGAMNGTETDVDCGGSCGATCGPEKICATGADCRGGACGGGVCEPTCTDEAKSGKETAIDCGGPDCGACALGEGCVASTDCVSGVCKVEACVDYFQWADRFGDAAEQRGKSVAFDGAGDIVVAGDFAGSVNFGGGPLSNSGGMDVFVTKKDPAGKHLWGRAFGAASDQHAGGVAADASGNVIISWYGPGSESFGDDYLISKGGNDAFVGKLDPMGKPLWGRSYGSAGDETAADVAVDGAGNVVLVGTFQGSVDFGGGLLTSAGGSALFIVKLAADGTYMWSKSFDAAVSQLKVAASKSGHIGVTGAFSGVLNFGGGELVCEIKQDGFVVVFEPSGEHIASKQIGGGGFQAATCVAFDESDNVLLGGMLEGDTSLGGRSLSASNGSLFVGKLNPFGEHVWSKSLGGDFLRDCAVTPSGAIFLAGSFMNSVDFGGGPLESFGTLDTFIVSLDASGGHISSKGFGDDQQDQQALAIALDSAGYVAVTGELSGAIDFGGGDLTSAGLDDVFLAKLAPP